jgi:tetratricopeptide (TPR) repeat protein
MMIKIVINLVVALLLLSFFTGCTPNNIKENEDASSTDLLTLREEADVAYQNDDLETGEKHYTILVKEIPEEALHWYRLANIYVRTNRPYPAINLYREAVLRDPKFSSAWYNMGIVQLKQTAFSLNEMLIYTDKNDPLYGKAANMLEKIQAIIKE